LPVTARFGLKVEDVVHRWRDGEEREKAAVRLE